MVCPNCEGGQGGCEECGHTGRFLIEGCPHADNRIGRDGAEVIFAADQAAQGVWPVSGGWLEQSAMAVEAVRRVWSEEAEWKRRAEE